MFSVGDRYGDRVRQGSNRTPCVSRKIRTRRATHGLALACWKMTFGRPIRQNTTTGCKMLERYRSAFKLPSIRIREMLVVYPMATKIITQGARILYRYRMQVGDMRFPWSLQTCIWPSKYCTQNWDSEKTILCNSCIQLYRSAHQSHRLSLSLFLSMLHYQGKLK